MELGSMDLFRARWTLDIQREWRSALLRDQPWLRPEKLDETQRNMNEAILGAVVDGYDELIPSLDLPDPDDRHVLAAAIRCGANAIITKNLKDFPTNCLAKYQLEALHPDTFLIDQYDLDRGAVIASVRKIRARLRFPPMTALDYLEKLRQNGLAGFAEELRPHLSAL